MSLLHLGFKSYCGYSVEGIKVLDSPGELVKGEITQMRLSRILALAITIALAAGVVHAQGDPTQRGQRARGEQQQPQTAPPAAAAGQQRPTPPPEEKSSVTRHSAKIGGQQINYTATAATYVIKADDGSPKATFFFVAYTKDESDATKRPLSFVYNGGPGSASSYTHMGLGPKRIVLTDDGFGMPAPYSVIENGDSFLDVTDLVFVDAISTG